MCTPGTNLLNGSRRVRRFPISLASAPQKKQLIRHLLRHATLERLETQIECEHFLIQDRCAEVDYLRFLYFGRAEQNLTAFTLRDLGVMGRSRFRSEFTSRFATREEAHVSFHYETLLRRLEAPGGAELEALVSLSHSWPDAVDPETDRLRSQAFHRLGQALERAGRSEDAIAVYRQSGQFPATERVARLLLAQGRREEAEAWLRGLIDAPSCDEELLFAEDFLARTFGTRRVGRLTALLRSAETIQLDEAMRNHTEAAAIEHFRRRGLDSGAFYETHETEIRSRLASLSRREETIRRLEETWDRYAGTPNAIFAWYADVFSLTRLLVSKSPPGSLAAILEPTTACLGAATG